MSAVDDLIERLERKTGQRIDYNDGDNNAMAGLFGAMSRLMGESPSSYTEHEDVAAGILIKHQMSPEYEREQEGWKLVKSMLMSGMPPDDVKSITG